MLLQHIWEGERIPDEWRSGIIVKLSKKGDLSACNNWRGIQLLSLPLKSLSRILLERLKTSVDKQLRDEQAGFRTSKAFDMIERSTIEDNPTHWTKS